MFISCTDASRGPRRCDTAEWPCNSGRRQAVETAGVGQCSSRCVLQLAVLNPWQRRAQRELERMADGRLRPRPHVVSACFHLRCAT